jgi:hypothetical protein
MEQRTDIHESSRITVFLPVGISPELLKLITDEVYAKVMERVPVCTAIREYR